MLLHSKKSTEVIPQLISDALDAGIHANYVLFDSWFSSPKVIRSMKELGLDVVAMVKKSSKIHYHFQGKMCSCKDIFRGCKHRRGRSRYLLSVPVEICGGELKSLPAATAGDIFYVDSNSAWNHVGLYQTSTVIVEAMPDDGVQFWSIYNQESYQEPVDNSNDSCILRVSSLSSTMRGNVATWPSNNITAGTPYDYDFLNNKSDYYTVNMGTTDMPNYVTYPESDAYNCSELVWKAFKKVASVDLDNNGGLGVYPNDIYNSSLTVSVNSTWWQ